MSSRPKLERLSGQQVDTCRAPSPVADLDAFYRQAFLPLVRRATWKHHLSKDDARDIVQDAFVVAIPRIDLAANPRAWLIQVVDHLAMNHQRKAFRRAQLAERWNPRSDQSRAEVQIDKEEDW